MPKKKVKWSSKKARRAPKRKVVRRKVRAPKAASSPTTAAVPAPAPAQAESTPAQAALEQTSAPAPREEPGQQH